MRFYSLIFTFATIAFTPTALDAKGLETSAPGTMPAATAAADNGNEKIETRVLDLKDFHGLNINSVGEIYYTRGNEYRVEASGTAKAFRQTGILVKDGLLTTKQNENKGQGFDGNIKMEPLTLRIVSPSLDVLINAGYITFHTSEISSADFKLGNSGDLIFDMQAFVCRSIDITNSGNLQMKCSISADNYEQGNSGNSNIKADYNIKNSFKYTNSGSTEISGTLTASYVEINNSGSFTPAMTINADTLKSVTSGETKADIYYKGGKADIVCSGNGDFNMKVDCQDLSTFASGNLKVKIAGTADNVKLDGSGRSNVDMTQLNNF